MTQASRAKKKDNSNSCAKKPKIGASHFQRDKKRNRRVLSNSFRRVLERQIRIEPVEFIELDLETYVFTGRSYSIGSQRTGMLSVCSGIESNEGWAWSYSTNDILEAWSKAGGECWTAICQASTGKCLLFQSSTHFEAMKLEHEQLGIDLCLARTFNDADGPEVGMLHVMGKIEEEVLHAQSPSPMRAVVKGVGLELDGDEVKVGSRRGAVDGAIRVRLPDGLKQAAMAVQGAGVGEFLRTCLGKR